jgi:hypothetical protein
MTRKQHGSMLRFILLLWGIIFILAIVETIFHVIVFIAVSLILAGLAYKTGVTNGKAAQIQAHKRLWANMNYGRTIPGYRGGSYPRGPVEDMDAVSAYPAQLTEVNDPPMRETSSGVWARDDFAANPQNIQSDEYPDRRPWRSRLLNDPLSGARPLFKHDGNDDNESDRA